MSSRLGRNPFEKKLPPSSAKSAVEFIKELESREQKEHAQLSATDFHANETFGTKIARFVFVDARAESYLLALKAYMLSLAVLSN